MSQLSLAIIAGCSPSFEKTLENKYVGVLTVYFDSGPDKEIRTKPYETENEAIIFAAAASILLVQRISSKH